MGGGGQVLGAYKQHLCIWVQVGEGGGGQGGEDEPPVRKQRMVAGVGVRGEEGGGGMWGRLGVGRFCVTERIAVNSLSLKFPLNPAKVLNTICFCPVSAPPRLSSPLLLTAKVESSR